MRVHRDRGSGEGGPDMSGLMILGVCGSPRNGNSAFLLGEAMKAAAEAAPVGSRLESYTFRGKKFRACSSCYKCGELGGECVIKDDFQALRDLWVAADVVIYSVPVYHMGMPGQVKCFIDRLGNSLFARYSPLYPPGRESLPRHLKAIGGIAQGIHAFSGQESTLTQLVNHALLMQCVPVSGDMWECYIGAGGWTSNAIEKDALATQVAGGGFDAGVVAKAARDVGRRCVETALLLRAGGLAERARLADDPTYTPFLERISGNG